MMQAPALDVRDLAKSFGGFRAVDGLSFAIAKGEIAALIGPNGAGKTTTFNMINGQLRPDRGSVTVDGEDATGLTPQALARRGVGRSFQITATFASMTVAENIGVALMAAGRGPWHVSALGEADDRAVTDLAAAVGLAGREQQSAATLAYGDLKRVELAMALAGKPKLLLMDEPTAGMAAAERDALMALAAGIARERGMTVLFTEHDMGVVFRHASRVLVMNEGRLIADGPPESVRTDLRVAQVYLGKAQSRIEARR